MIDLNLRLHQVNEEYFQSRTLPEIKWSRGRIKKRYKKLTFGSYDFKKDEIRIHPLLKDENIPSFVLDYILFHEMLHYQDREDLKNMRQGKFFRRSGYRAHSPSFRFREKIFHRRKEALKIMRAIVMGQEW